MFEEVLAGGLVFWALLAGIVLTVLLACLQARDARIYKAKLSELLSNRQAAALQPDTEVIEPDWFMEQLQLPVCLIDIESRRVLTINRAAQSWFESQGVSAPELFIEESLATEDDHHSSFSGLRCQFQNKQWVARSFSDSLRLNAAGGEVECSIELSVLPFQRGESRFMLVFMGNSGQPASKSGVPYRRLIDATLTEPSLAKALQSVVSLLEADAAPDVYASISTLDQQNMRLELVSRLGLPDALSSHVHACSFVHGASVNATAGVTGKAIIQDLRRSNEILPARLASDFLEAGIHCWASYPIFGLHGAFLGTFDVYLAGEQRIDALTEQITVAMRLAGATLERHWSLNDLQETVKRESFIRAFHQALITGEDTGGVNLYEAALARVATFCGVEDNLELWALDAVEQNFERVAGVSQGTPVQPSPLRLNQELIINSFEDAAPVQGPGGSLLRLGCTHEIYRRIYGNRSGDGGQALLRPLRAGAVVEGFLIWHARNREPEGYTSLVQSVAPVLAASLARKRLLASLERQALYDYLTGLYSRRKIEDALGRLIDKTVRYQGIFSILLFDIDRFKSINDSLGHAEGDNVLRQVSCRVRQGIRGSDLIGRWGGEEFLAVLPETDLGRAEVVGEQVRELVASGSYGDAGKVTVSVGVASYQKGDSVEALVKRADQALYEAKSAGRNCVIVSS